MRRLVAVLGVLAAAVVAAALSLRGCDEADLGRGPSAAVSAERPGTPVEESPPPAGSRPRAAPPPRAVATGDASAADAASAAPLPPGRLAGRVVTQRGDDPTPVAGATVRLVVGVGAEVDQGKWLSPKADAIPRAAAESVTGADGAFAFEVAADAQWRLAVTHSDLGPASRHGTGPEEGLDVEISAEDAARITVVDPAGAPIPDAEARVFLKSGDLTPSVVVRGFPSGEIRVRPASASVLVTAPGRSFRFVQDVRDGLEVRLGPGYDVAGIVVDDAGSPIAGLELVLQDDDNTRVARTDAAGAFRFERVAAGREVNVWLCSAEGSEVRQVSAGDLAVRLVLVRAAEISGVVVDEDGTPVKGAEVDAEGTTGADGTFRVKVPWSGAGELRAQVREAISRGCRISTKSGRASVVASAGAVTSGVRIVLRPEQWSFFRVRVVDEDGSLVLASVVVRAPWSSEGQNDGLANIVGVAPGTPLEITARELDARGRTGAGTVVTSADLNCEPVEIRLQPLPVLQVRVVGPAGAEIPPSEWTAFAVEGSGVEKAPGGRIVCAPGAYFRLVVVVAGGRRFDDHVFAPAEGPREIRLEFPATVTVRGRFVLAGGRPAAGVNVQITTTRRGAQRCQVGAGPTGSDGVFVLEGVVPGSADLYGSRENDVPACFRQFVMPGTGDLDLGDVPSWDDVEVTGRVTVPEGESLAGITVRFAWDEGRQGLSTACDAAGRFRLRAPDVDAVVTARRPGRLAAVAGADLRRRGDVIVALRPVGDLRVRLPAAWDGAPWTVYLASRDGRLRWEPDLAWTGRKHTGTVREVPSGPWTVVVESEAAGTRRRDVTVVAGEETLVGFE